MLRLSGWPLWPCEFEEGDNFGIRQLMEVAVEFADPEEHRRRLNPGWIDRLMLPLRFDPQLLQILRKLAHHVPRLAFLAGRAAE